MLSIFKNNIYQGAGINLRLEMIDEILVKKPKIKYLEVIVDNWFSDGPHHKKLENLRQDYDILFHCVGMNLAGLDKINDTYIKKVKDLSVKFKPKHISDHLCFQNNNGHFHHDLMPIPYNQESLKNTIERVSYAQESLNQKILIENLSYYVQYKSSDLSEAQFLKYLRDKTSCNYLLDLNNIWTNEKNLNISAKEFLNTIDHKGIKEIHIAGSTIEQGLYIDTHGTNPSKEVYELLNTINYKENNIPIIYERDSDLKPLKASIKVLNNI